MSLGWPLIVHCVEIEVRGAAREYVTQLKIHHTVKYTSHIKIKSKCIGENAVDNTHSLTDRLHLENTSHS